MVGHISEPPEFKFSHGHAWRAFHLSLHLTNFGGNSGLVIEQRLGNKWPDFDLLIYEQLGCGKHQAVKIVVKICCKMSGIMSLVIHTHRQGPYFYEQKVLLEVFICQSVHLSFRICTLLVSVVYNIIYNQIVFDINSVYIPVIINLFVKWSTCSISYLMSQLHFLWWEPIIIHFSIYLLHAWV